MTGVEVASAPWTLILAWAGYLGLHSLLAATEVKRVIRKQTGWQPGTYRLAYNLVAVLLLLPIAVYLWTDPGTSLWAFPWHAALGLDLVAAASLLALALSGPRYNLREFAGWRNAGPAMLIISGWHRFVRHPWYAVLLVVVWTRPMSVAWLVSAICITAYVWIGSALEEAKLEARYGEAYRRYRSRVPALLPWRGAAITSDEARRIEAAAAAARPAEESPD